MNLDRALRWGMALLAVLLAVWLSQALEWAEVDTQEPAQGEAATNSWYASQSLITRLGGKVVKNDSLRDLPSPGATLVLTSPHWDLIPDNVARLRQWVEQGGQLVIPAYFLDQKKFSRWIPMESVENKPQKKTAPAPAAEEGEEEDDAAPPVTRGCHPTTEYSAGQPARSLQVCAHTFETLQTQATVLWSLRNDQGYEALRIAVGQGSVTALEANGIGMREELFRADNAQAWVRALQLHSGGEIWFVINEKRPPLLRWLWSQAWVALLLLASLIALALWRNALRFGPVTPAPTLARRSMAEQVRGTAQFLRRRSAQTLHQAQLRALDEAAVRQLGHYRRLSLQDRAQGVARLTQLDTPALTHAMRTDVLRNPLATLQALRLLETARRRLLETTRHRPETPPYQP